MDISTAFPSKYLKASDLRGTTPTVTIGQANMENMADGARKIVLYFYGKEKGLVLNKTNANTIAKAYGTNTEGWNGQKIVLFEAMVEFKGEQVQSIRVRPAPAAAAPAQVQQPATPVARPQMSEMNDEIPF